MISLRPGQKEVARYRGGLLAVPAVPGAGKTTVLAHLTADLIQEGCSGSGKILIVTVMNSAVANFRSRIGDFLQQRGLPRGKGYEVKTLHSLAMTILKEKPEFLLINQNFRIIDEGGRYELLNDLVKEWMITNKNLWKEPIKIKKNDRWYQRALERWEQKDLPNIFCSGVSTVKSTGLTAEQVRNLQQRLDERSYLSWVLSIYQRYNQVLNREGLLDFDDLIVQALRLLKEDGGVLERLQNRWTFCFEDEAQDSTPLQEEILMLLAEKSGNLVRVGDSNQAILGTFTAAEPEIFRRYCTREDVKKESILYSSRSTVQIINLANYLVDWTNNCHPQQECREALENRHIHPVDKSAPYPNPSTKGYTIGVRGFKDQAAEIKLVAQLAGDYINRTPRDTVAILVSNRYVQQDMAQVLTELNVPFEEVGKITNRQAKTIVDVERALEYLAQPHRVNLLVALVKNVFLSQLSAEEGKFLTKLFQKYTLQQVLYPIGGQLPWLEMPDELSDPAIYTGFVEGLKTIQKWLAASVQLPPDELVLYLAEDMDLDMEQLGIAHNLALLIRQKMYQHPHWRLYDIALDLPSLKSSVRHFLRVVNEQQGFEPTPGVISLITAHKSKGLEWDTVYLTGVTAAEYPSSRTDRFKSEMWYLKEDLNNPLALIKAELKSLTGERVTDPLYQFKIDEICERLRLLYVAVTRAKKNLLITYHDKNVFNQRIGPSLVLKALMDHISKERAANDNV
ncbi:DNA helicase-2/ATP-dependent DNA helicase PcrA [Desulfohalotomaculum tongense]|uniref:UvrD-helicase domain-containing protein n=1 Tax=Desulforadius tongensis TaxID=1216062 RepID=UPI00195733F6|nr:DNA helicase-2/ATP-dependent DNA helicase PcrA [Desulforadius tongensis]